MPVVLHRQLRGTALPGSSSTVPERGTTRTIIQRPALQAVAAFLVLVGACGGGTAETTGAAPSTTSLTSTTTTSPATTTTTTTPTTTTAADQLTAALAAVESNDCVTYNVVRLLLEGGPADPGFDTMGIAAVGLSLVFTGVPMMRFLPVMTEMSPDFGYWPFASPESEAVGLQTQLFFNQERNTATFFLATDGTYSIPVFASPQGAQSNDPNDVVALFEGTDPDDGTLLVPNGTEYEMDLWNFTRFFPTLDDPALILDDTARREAWRRADEWLVELGPIVDAFRVDADYRGVASELEPFIADLDVVIPLFCLLLATENATLAAAGGSPDALAALGMYIAADELLLATEYLEVIRDHMTADGIDWFRGPNADNKIEADGSTSSAEDFIVWQYAIDYALSRVVQFRSAPGAEFPPPSIPQSEAG